MEEGYKERQKESPIQDIKRRASDSLRRIRHPPGAFSFSMASRLNSEHVDNLSLFLRFVGTSPPLSHWKEEEARLHRQMEIDRQRFSRTSPSMSPSESR